MKTNMRTRYKRTNDGSRDWILGWTEREMIEFERGVFG